MNDNQNTYKPSGSELARFIIPSLIGAFLFLAPIPTADAFIIPLGIIINVITDAFGQIYFTTYAPETVAGRFGLHYIIGFIAINIAFFGMLLAHFVKPEFIMSRPRLYAAFHSSPIYFVSKIIGFVFAWMIFLNIGPDAVIASWTGDVMMGLIGSLSVIFLVLIPGIPLLTDFGLMEFIGIFIKKFVRTLFTLPGRASVDLIASWFGSSGASIMITRDQHEKGFYTGREAAVATTNFAIVSVPFTFVIANLIGLAGYFFTFYFIMCVTVLFLALLLPRVWPLKSIPDTYLEGVGKQIEEEVPANVSQFNWAVESACKKAQKTTSNDVISSAVNGYYNIFLDLMPIFLAWGTVVLMIAELTPFFDIISYPMGMYLSLLQVEGAFAYAPATLVGFFDMYIPALLIGSAPIETRMILGVLSIVQVIYLAETGILILKSKIPLGIGKLFALFMMRTIIGLPIIVLMTSLVFNP
ncbi:MAG: hypothetical protein FWE92_02420 [Defluviitaleaceae bacterium]|nr:hypothetical protein [Defluviitaleaceae bacterium]